MRHPRAAPARDMPASAFAHILSDLIARVPGAFAAALVDGEGECVDYAGRTAPFDAKIAAAHWHIVYLDLSRRLHALGRARTLLVRGARRSFLVQALPEEYALVLILTRRAGFGASHRALDLCERAVAREAGWTAPSGGWHPIYVECRGRKPVGVAAEPFHRVRRRKTRDHDPDLPRVHPVELLGSLAGRARERGYRVRLDTGAELTIVCEAGGFWYADEPIPAASARTPRPR